MTGYTVHTGSTVKFSGGWDRIFSGGKTAQQGHALARKSVKKTVAKAKKSPTKSVAKKNQRKKRG